MRRVPKPNVQKDKKVTPNNIIISGNDSIVFSFGDWTTNEYFNLDSTCENWSSELFDCMRTVSNISKKDIEAGKYSGKNSKLRIHNHKNATPPCKLPPNIDLEEFYQIRISASKGGMHGVFVENVFYVIWLDPHHNMYPDERYGGLKVIQPPNNCCKDRDQIIEELSQTIESLKTEVKEYEELINSTC